MDTKKRIKRIKKYSAQMGMLFSNAVDDILSMFKQTPKLDKGVMFSFDSLGVNKQKEVSDKLRHLHSVALLAVKNGITAEWSYANDDMDELVESIAGYVANDPNFAGWFARNDAARDAFISRSEAGLNLSDRIWKPSGASFFLHTGTIVWKTHTIRTSTAWQRSPGRSSRRPSMEEENQGRCDRHVQVDRLR